MHHFIKIVLKIYLNLPIITHFEKIQVIITSSIIYAKDEETGNQNSSTHRMLLLNSKEMVIRMVNTSTKCFVQSKDRKEDLKINIVIGVHPAVKVSTASGEPTWHGA